MRAASPSLFHELAGDYKIICLGDDAAGFSLFSISAVTPCLAIET
jgi:hypothetical protein